jgi:hypothetical protein
MGFLEVCVDVLQLHDNFDLTTPSARLFSFIILVAAIFLSRILKAPRKDELSHQERRVWGPTDSGQAQ